MITWLEISNFEFSNINECLKRLKEKNCYVSPWIENICEKYNYKFVKIEKPKVLTRVKVEDFGFNGPTELQAIYKKIENEGFKLVEPQTAIYARLLYTDQPSGEWLRFATPFDSMVDTDGVPHLPKHGRALGKNFIETYWSYRKAIFHPHNEFVVEK